MKRRLSHLLLCGLLAALPAAAADTAAGAGDLETRMAEMLRGAGARPTECPRAVTEQVRRQEMKVLCARFDGSFERFALSWNRQIFQHVAFDGDRPRTAAETEWQRGSGDAHERVYRIDETAVGVRFSTGDVLLVW